MCAIRSPAASKQAPHVLTQLSKKRDDSFFLSFPALAAESGGRTDGRRCNRLQVTALAAASAAASSTASRRQLESRAEEEEEETGQAPGPKSEFPQSINHIEQGRGGS